MRVKLHSPAALAAAAILIGGPTGAAWSRSTAGAPFPAAPSLMHPALRIEQAYNLGIAAYTPAAVVFRLDQQIKQQRTPMSQTAAFAEQTRADELAAYHSALTILKQMGAPDSVTRLFTVAEETVGRSLLITDTARQQVPGDPAAQRVWSILDEADRIAPQDSGTLSAWIKLSRGRDALWAYHLGNLVACIQTATPGKPSDLPLLDGASALLASVPANTPAPVADALRAVADQQRRHRVTPDTLQRLETAVADVFGPGPLPQPSAR